MFDLFLNWVQRAYKTKRTVVYECYPYLNGQYSHTSYDMIRTTDLVENVIASMPGKQEDKFPLSHTMICQAIRITAVY